MKCHVGRRHDIQQCTRVAKAMVTQLGFSEVLEIVQNGSLNGLRSSS